MPGRCSLRTGCCRSSAARHQSREGLTVVPTIATAMVRVAPQPSIRGNVPSEPGDAKGANINLPREADNFRIGEFGKAVSGA